MIFSRFCFQQLNKYGQYSKYIKNTGFTLLEVLIALFIISMISMMAYQSIDNMIKVEPQLESTDKMLNSIHKTFVQWQSDCKIIEKQSIDGFSENIGLIHNNNQNTNAPSILWLIRRNIKSNNSNINNISSEWQLIVYMHYQKKWMRIAFKPTLKSQDLHQTIQDIKNTPNYQQLVHNAVQLLPSDAFSLNIWHEQKWQAYTINQTLSSTRALQLAFILPIEWHKRLGAEQHMNCMLKM
jgi:prepilin-type N-terminal cleavage/methylation domain-containing protein